MKIFQFLFLSLLILLGTTLKSQQNIIDTTKPRPQDIPSPDVLKSMGLPDAMIQTITNFKLRNLNNPGLNQNPQDTSRKAALMRKSAVRSDTNKYKADTTKMQPKYPPGRIWGQDLFRNKNIKFFDKATQTMAPDGYLLGVGDVINISVWGFAEYNDAFIINQSGFITPKYIGRVYLKGLKFADAKSLLISKFGQVTDLKNSQIDIILNYSRVIKVNIVGEVYNPGTYSIPAVNTMFNALVAASGQNQVGSVRSIYLKRNNKIIDSLDVYQFLLNPNSKNDIYLENNDYIIVVPAKAVVTIVGEVNRPAVYELKGNETINNLINYSGQLLPSAYTANIQIKRFTNNKMELININLDSLMKNKNEFNIKDGDQVFVDKISQELTNITTAIGSVKIPGSYQFKEGDRVSDLLVRAQGITYDAYTKIAYIIREKEDMAKKYLTINLSSILRDNNSADNIVLEKFDTLKVFSKNDFNDFLKVSVFGSVRKPGDIDYGDNLSLKDVIMMTGGLKQEAANNRIEISRIIDYDKRNNKALPIRAIVNTVQVGSDLSLSEEAKNFLLQPYDHVYVRANPDFEEPKTVFITGEVMYPGVYSLTRKDETIAEVIKRAGGLTAFAYIDGVKMSRKFEETGLVYLNLEKAIKRPRSKYNIVLNDSDVVDVPKTVDLVHISGAIGNVNFKNISAPYFSNKRAKFYIKQFAGGFGKDCNRGRTYVVYPNGILRKTKDLWFVRVYPKVRNGSNIQLTYKDVKITDKSKRAPLDWNKAIENFTVKLTGVITLWLLITKLK